MLNRGHTTIAAGAACAAILIGPAPISWANAPSGRPSGNEFARHVRSGSALTNAQVAALAEIQQGAIEAGLHPGVFGPRPAANVPPVIPLLATQSGGFDWGDAGIGAGGAFALTLVASGAALTAIRRRNDRIHDHGPR